MRLRKAAEIDPFDTSRTSKPAKRKLIVIKSCVRVPANTSACPPGFNTRYTSRHKDGGGTNPSQSFDMNPLPSGTNEGSPLTHSDNTFVISGALSNLFGRLES